MNLLMQCILSRGSHRSFLYRTGQTNFIQRHFLKKRAAMKGGFSLPDIKSYFKAEIIKVL